MTDTLPLYRPDALLDKMTLVLSDELPGNIRADRFQTDVTVPGVNLWPGSPRMENLTVRGPSRARLTITARSLGRDADEAVKLGALVRLTFREDSRGKLVHDFNTDDIIVHTITTMDGHLDNSGATPVWVETVEVLYQSRAEVTPQPS